MIKILGYLKPKEWLCVLIVTLLAVAQVLLDLRLPGFMSRITVLVQTPGSDISEIWQNGVFMLLCTLGSLACVIAICFFASRVSAALSMRLRGMVFDRVQSFSLEEVSRLSVSSLITRSTNDITQVQTFFMAGMQMLLKVPILLIGGIWRIAGLATNWTLATIAAAGFMLIVVAIVMALVLPQFKKMQSHLDRMNLSIRESLTGRFVVRAYNAEEFQTAKSELANDAFTRIDLRTNRTMAAMSPAMSIASNGLSIAVYIIGAYLISVAGALDALDRFSDLVVFTAYVALVMTAMKFITKTVPRFPRAMVSAKRINEVLGTEPIIKDCDATEAEEDVSVEFINVGFRYPGAVKDAISNISFKARKGETVAFIGSTGSGKTTLVNLIPRLFTTTQGEVLVGGVNVRDYKKKSLVNKIGYVPQKSVLLKGTVRSNIAYGDNGSGGYTDEDVERAADIAQAGEFISALDDGFAAPVSQGGSNFSGGQKQRLAIARAVCREPEIYILDDSFSALDYKTDRDLRIALKNTASDSVRLIVAQRIGTVMDADQIIVLHDGEIVGKGTHGELLRDCSVYQEIAATQLETASRA